MTLEEIKKVLEEKQAQKVRFELAYQQLLGQIGLLEELIKKDGENTKQTNG